MSKLTSSTALSLCLPLPNVTSKLRTCSNTSRSLGIVSTSVRAVEMPYHGRRLYLGRARVQQPCPRLMRRRNIEVRRPDLKVNLERIRVARREGVAPDFVEQV